MNYQTCIISAFSGCGKTYSYDHQNDILFDLPNGQRHLVLKDSDSSQYNKKPGWEKKYVDDILQCKGQYDFVLVTMNNVVLQELVKRNIPFIMVMPRNFNVASEEERLFIKQQFFGRIALRDNSFIRHDFTKWITHCSEKYDNWITEDTVAKYHPVAYELLPTEEGEWNLTDIIRHLAIEKELNPEKYCI